MVTNLIPMAGKGQRFANSGYKVNKPLIQVSGKPMIIQAIKTFPEADNWIFVCRKEHIENDKIDERIKEEYPNSRFIPIDYTTEGQACTCMLAKPYINGNEPLFIGSCDIGMSWNKQDYYKLINEDDTDIVCFGFTRQSVLMSNPKAFGWIKLREDKKTIEKVSVKVPISENPYNDYAVVGFFYFKTAEIFSRIVEDLIKNNIRTNNEFYVDNCINQGIKLGYTAKIFIVNQFIGWGTPQDLREYELWEKYFTKKRNCLAAKGFP